MFLDYLKDIVDALVKLDKKIGFLGLLRYIILILLVFTILNFKSVVKGCVELVTEIQEDIHTEKMEKRDQLLAELIPILAEFRGELGADRVLYFEYHNSKENLIGIPFKYIDLVLQSTRYGVIPIDERDFKDLNAGTIAELYETIKFGEVVYCHGDTDFDFQTRYPGAYNLFNVGSDGSKNQLYISISGINQPLGLIVVEWLDNEKRNVSAVRSIYRTFMPRISGLILSKQ